MGPCCARGPRILISGVRQVLDVLEETYDSSCLALNFKPGKTACLFWFAGNDHKATHQGFVEIGRDLGLSVPAFQTYRNRCSLFVSEDEWLGSWADINGNQNREVSLSDLHEQRRLPPLRSAESRKNGQKIRVDTPKRRFFVNRFS
eukprot:1425717-Amphidinium_carterae.1